MWHEYEGKSYDGGWVISAEEGGGADIIWERDSMMGPYSITFGIYGFGLVFPVHEFQPINTAKVVYINIISDKGIIIIDTISGDEYISIPNQ